jgi:hypothetical protein
LLFESFGTAECGVMHFRDVAAGGAHERCGHTRRRSSQPGGGGSVQGSNLIFLLTALQLSRVQSDEPRRSSAAFGSRAAAKPR